MHLCLVVAILTAPLGYRWWLSMSPSRATAIWLPCQEASQGSVLGASWKSKYKLKGNISSRIVDYRLTVQRVNVKMLNI